MMIAKLDQDIYNKWLATVNTISRECVTKLDCIIAYYKIMKSFYILMTRTVYK